MAVLLAFGGLVWLALRAGPAQPGNHAEGLEPSIPVIRRVGASGARPAVRTARSSASTQGSLRASALVVARGLSADQLAGQRVIYAYAGLRPPRSLLALIRAGEAAGVILFAPNISTSAQVRGTVGLLQRAATASRLHRRLLILADQEGGAVRRLPGAPAQSEKEIGASPEALGLASSAGAAAAGDLSRVGINVNLAPVLDVFRQPGSFIDRYGRSYSSDAKRTASLGAAFVTAQQRAGIGATLKHFPGLGAATGTQNTDLRPVVLGLSAAELRSVDEVPYRSAIAAGAALVMTSWAVYPSLDRSRPAGLSPAVIRGELRGRLGFRGVTITDGIDAGGVTRFGRLGPRVVLAAAAGADLILCAGTSPVANTPSEGLTALRALAAALRRGQLSRATAEQAASRVLVLRSRS